MDWRSPTKGVTPSSYKERDLGSVDSSVRVHLVEEEHPRPSATRTYDRPAEFGIGECSVQHLRGGEQDVGRLFLDASAGQSQLIRPRTPRAGRALKNLETLLQI